MLGERDRRGLEEGPAAPGCGECDGRDGTERLATGDNHATTPWTRGSDAYRTHGRRAAAADAEMGLGTYLSHVAT